MPVFPSKDKQLNVKRYITFNVTLPSADVLVGASLVLVGIPDWGTGLALVRAQALVRTAGVTGATTIQIVRTRAGTSVDMLSNPISISSNSTIGITGTVNQTNKDTQTDDLVSVSVLTVSTTAPKGLVVVLTFER